MKNAKISEGLDLWIGTRMINILKIEELLKKFIKTAKG